MSPPRPSRHRPAALAAALVAVFGFTLFVPAPAQAQACTAVTLDPPVSGALDFGRLYVAAGVSGTATLDPVTGQLSATGRLVGPQAGAPLQIRVIDASPDCEFRLILAPASRDFAAGFSVEADRIAVLEGDLLNADPGQREWLIRMNNGVARIAVGGRLEMNTASDSVIDAYTVTFTATVEPS